MGTLPRWTHRVSGLVKRPRVFSLLGNAVVRWPWVVVACWVVLAVSLPLTFPSLTQMVQQRPVAILPPDAPVAVATREMTRAFHESGSENVLLVVLSNDKGLGPADETAYRKLADTLRVNTHDVVMLQDFGTTPAIREVMTSKDGKAWILPVGGWHLRQPWRQELTGIPCWGSRLPWTILLRWDCRG